MRETDKSPEDKVYWIVGASYSTGDQTQRFIEQGIWENGYEDKYLDLVRSIEPGDQIAVKSAYTRKNDLPFDNRGHTVSVMGIKARGIVMANMGDGRTIKVNWERFDPIREWYLYSYFQAIWRVTHGDWKKEALIEFVFEDKPQDIDKFRNAPTWRERFGDKSAKSTRFPWTQFYATIADSLLQYKEDRTPLIEELHKIAKRVKRVTPLNDKQSDGSRKLLDDICPFTVMGTFNRSITVFNRQNIARELARFLEVKIPVPNSFFGIPVLNNQNSWFFSYESNRQPDDIDALWRLFEISLDYADSSDPELESTFSAAYDDAINRRGPGWMLTTGLFWIRPWSFPTLDGQSRTYITSKLNLKIECNGPKGRSSAAEYLQLRETLSTRFEEDEFPAHSFPELSAEAYMYQGEIPEDDDDDVKDTDTDTEGNVVVIPVTPAEPYSVDNIIAEGCFLPKSEVRTILERLRVKRNIILQGPPGTGKTWLAKRLGYALIGAKAKTQVRSVQFHANLSYEDFVRGYRPGADGRLDLVDGPFLEVVSSALNSPAEKHVIVIEEINRGNPAQIFGELLTLLEADKRTPEAALELSYRRSKGETVHIPRNLFVIGTMNIADRSLALVDYALRRRFAFVDLEPAFGKVWRDWLASNFDIAEDISSAIEERMTALNRQIADSPNLGRQFCVGHSYVTPPLNTDIKDPWLWFKQVAITEISPLLEEYWFDSVESARKAKEKLIEGI